jgi:hypothetical protein
VKARAVVKSIALAALALGGVALSGCTPYFYPVTDVPPAHQGRFAGVDAKGIDQIVLSKGVAMAFECREPWLGDPCANATATSADPRIAAVMPTHLQEAQNPWGNRYMYGGYAESQIGAQRTGFVIAGVEKGETTITVSSTDGNRTFHVIVAER